MKAITLAALRPEIPGALFCTSQASPHRPVFGRPSDPWGLALYLFEFGPPENTHNSRYFRKPTLWRQYATNPRRSLLHPLGITTSPPFRRGISPEGPSSTSVQSLVLLKALTIVFLFGSQHFGSKTPRIPGELFCTFWALLHRRFFAET